MTCDWCTLEATNGGKAPVGVVGRTELFACDFHAQVIAKLKFIPMDERELRVAQKKKAQEAKQRQ